MERKLQNKDIPYVTIGLMTINVVYFIVLYAAGALENGALLVKYGASVPPGELWRERYRLITSTFMHFDITHLCNNMLMLYFVGGYVEKALGRVKYLLCYLACAAGGSLASDIYFLLAGSSAVTVGASGAVFGLAGALAYIIIRHKGRYRDLTIHRMLIFLILAVYSGVSNSGVNNAAHVGGLVVGFLISALLYRGYKSKSDCNNIVLDL